MIAAVVAVVAACLMLRIVGLLREDSRRQAERFDLHRIRAAFAEPPAITARPAPAPGDWPTRQTGTDLAAAYTPVVIRTEDLPSHARITTGEWAALVATLVSPEWAAELAAVAT